MGISTFIAMLFTCRSILNFVFQILPLAAAFSATLVMSVYMSQLGAVALGHQEVLGTPMQQTVQYVIEGGELSDVERSALEHTYNMESALVNFEPQITDPVKGGYNRQSTTDETIDFIATYIKLGLRHPGSYLRAWYNLYSGYIEIGTFDSLATVRFLPAIPLVDLGIEYSDGMDFPNDLDHMLEFIQDDKVIYAQKLLPEYRETHPDFGAWKDNPDTEQSRKDFFSMLFGWAKIPGLNLLVSKGLYATYIPLILLLISIFSSNRKKLFPALVPMFCITLFAFVSPVDFTRYILPEIAVCFPMIIFVMFNLFKNDRKIKKDAEVSIGTVYQS